MKRILKSLPTTILFNLSLVAGLIYDIGWALNIGLFIAWIAIVMGALTFIASGRIKIDLNDERFKPRSTLQKVWSTLVGWPPILLLASCGYFVTAALLVFAWIVVQSLYDRAEKMHAAAKAAASPSSV